VGQQLKIVLLYKAREKFTPLFPSVESARGYHTAAEIRQAVADYVEKEKLVSPNNKRIVKLNPFLANTVIDGTQKPDADMLARSTVPRDALSDRILSACSPYHLMLRNTATPDGSSKPKAGAPPKVLVTTETRSGSKTVTKISGLEAFFIAPQPLADELRKTCAGSTSVDQLMGSSPKNPVMEVMVQGPQGQAVVAALEKRGVDRRYIELVDKTKKKK
jgi:translation initiation factor 2D